MPQQGTQCADLLCWPKRSLQQAHRMQVLQPLAIGYVGFSAGHVLYMMCIDQTHLEAALFQDLEKRYPEHSRGLHRHGFDPATLQPVCQPMQVLGKSLEGTHGLWIAINRNRHIDAGCTDVDSGGVLPLDGLGMYRRHLRLALFGHTHDSKEGIDRQERPGCAARGTLLNGIAGTASPMACARNLEPCC